MSRPKQDYTVNYQLVEVEIANGLVIKGKINIGDKKRISDWFLDEDEPFLVIVDYKVIKGGKGLTELAPIRKKIINKRYIVSVDLEEGLEEGLIPETFDEEQLEMQK